MKELHALAEEHDGLLTSKEARALGIQDSVLVRLAQRGRLERMSRGVYRIAHYPTDRLAQYREAVLWRRQIITAPNALLCPMTRRCSSMASQT
jgi:predicted transcriptional regulator of viral defense system